MDLYFAATLIGFVVLTSAVGKVLFLALRGFVTFVLARHLPIGVVWRDYSGWAVITGASDGIGKEFALQLAEKGLNIVLISRTLQKLNVVAEDIERKYRVKTRCIQLDFGKASTEDFQKLRTSLDDLQITVLVNNVGIFFDYPDLLHETPRGDKAILNVLNVDVVTLTTMIRLFLPPMLARKKGIVINLASSLGLQPVGTYAVYSAAKSYCIFLTQELRSEYEDSGVIFQTVIPGIVSTNMAKNYRDAPMQTTAETFVRAVLPQVGFRAVTNGYWKHALMATISSYTPRFLAEAELRKDSVHRKKLFLQAQQEEAFSGQI